MRYRQVSWEWSFDIWGEIKGIPEDVNKLYVDFAEITVFRDLVIPNNIRRMKFLFWRVLSETNLVLFTEIKI